MKVLGIDPGKTTGVCVVVNRPGSPPYPLASGEYKFDTAFNELLQLIRIHRPNTAIVESVVKTGTLNVDKHMQIQAFERAVLACGLASIKKVPVVIQSPEHTKKCQVVVPPEVKGRHARDAYRVAAAYLLKDA